MTSEKSVRGYIILAPAGFIEHAYDAPTRNAIFDLVAPETRDLLPRLKDIEWYPREHEVNIYRALATYHQRTGETAVRAAFFALGKATATRAMDSFLKLVMNVMTPQLYARKVPDVWRRDHKCGALEVDDSDIAANHLVFRFSDMTGYDYMGLGIEGFQSTALVAIGCKDVTCDCDWSFANPGPETVTAHFRWSGTTSPGS